MINQTTGKVISKEEAIDYTHSFQRKNPNKNIAYYVGKDQVSKILNQPNCIGLRIYDGVNPSTNQENRVLIGVDKNGEDIAEGVIVDELLKCPNHCPNYSPFIKK